MVVLKSLPSSPCVHQVGAMVSDGFTLHTHKVALPSAARRLGYLVDPEVLNGTPTD
jgi:hypothetical protein